MSPDQDLTTDGDPTGAGGYDWISPKSLEALKQVLTTSLFEQIVDAIEAKDASLFAHLTGLAMQEISAMIASGEGGFGGGPSGKSVTAAELQKIAGDFTLEAIQKARSAPLVGGEHRLSKNGNVAAVQKARSAAHHPARENYLETLAKWAGR